MERSAAAGVARSEANQLRTLPAVDVGNRPSRELRQDLLAQIAPVHIERSRLPDPLVALEHRLGDSLEEGFSGIARRILSPPDRGKYRAGARARFADTDGIGVPDDSSRCAPRDAGSGRRSVLRPEGRTRMPKPVSLPSRVSYAVLRGLSALTRASVRMIRGIHLLPVAVAAGERTVADSVPQLRNAGEKETLFQQVSTEGAQDGVAGVRGGAAVPDGVSRPVRRLPRH